MTPSKNFTVRLAIYSVALLYVAGDLFLFNGPLNRRIQQSRPDSAEALEHARSQGVVARVSGYPILLSQVERATKERLWLKGRTLDDLDSVERHEARLAALNDLIDHQLLRMKVNANAAELPVSDEEIDKAVRRLASRFSTRDEMKAELEAEGIDSEKELRYRLAARIQQVKYIERLIGKDLEVSEADARAWYEERKEEFAIPERARVRHIFLSTLNREPDAAKSTLAKALADLNSGGTDFSSLASSLSEDVRTKLSGGDLGWVTLDRLPSDLGEPVFAMAVGQRKLIRTKIGWHLVELLEKRPRELRSFEEAKEELMLALESAKRVERTQAVRDSIRATDDIGIHVFYDMITGE